MTYETATLTDFLTLATRFEIAGKAIMKRARGPYGWIVTDGSGTRTSRHATLESAFRELFRLSEVSG